MVQVDDREKNRLLRSLDEMSKEISRKSTRRRISNIAAVPVQMEFRKVASNEFKQNPKHAIHYYYREKKRIAEIHAGHTEASIQVMTKKRQKMPKAVSAVVGPLKTGKAGQGGVFRKTNALNPSKVDAYYAQWIFGSARAFGNRISEKGLRLGLPAAVRIYDKEVSKEINKQARKKGWR